MLWEQRDKLWYNLDLDTKCLMEKEEWGRGNTKEVIGPLADQYRSHNAGSSWLPVLSARGI